MQAGMRSFFYASAKIAVALLLTVLALSLLGWGVYELNELRAAQKVADLAVAKQWPERPNSNLKVTFKLKTVWRNQSMQYQFEVEGFPEGIANARKSPDSALFTLRLVDEDGFEVTTIPIELNSMTRVVSDGLPKGLRTQGSAIILAEDYRRAKRWSVAWKGFDK